MKTLATVLGSMSIGLAVTKKMKNSNHHRKIQGSFNKRQKNQPVFNTQALYKQSGLPFIPILGFSENENVLFEAGAKVNMYRVWETAEIVTGKPLCLYRACVLNTG